MAGAWHGMRELTAWARHGMCELMARHGKGTAWAWHAMRKSALNLQAEV